MNFNDFNDKPLEVGRFYKLAYDVKNATPDRRVKGNWACSPVWEEGMELYVDDHFVDDTRPRIPVITRAHDRFRTLHEVMPYHPSYGELAAAMVPLEMTPERRFDKVFMDGRYPGAESVLHRLMMDGVVTIEQIEETYKTLNEAEG